MADTDDPDLRERVAELEATVEAQQATIQQLLPSRRRVLQAGGLLAGGGVLGALTADRASADVTGQVGTSQDRVDVFAGDVDANSVNTEQVIIDGVSAGSTKTALTATDSNSRGGYVAIQPTDSVSTTAKTIWSSGGRGDRATAFLIVVGSDTDSNEEFWELVQYSRAASPTVINSEGVASDVTTYTRGGGGTMELEMSSGTWDVTVTAIEAAHPDR